MLAHDASREPAVPAIPKKNARGATWLGKGAAINPFPLSCVCVGVGGEGGAQGSPGPGRFVLQDSGDSAPCKPLCRVLPVGVRTLGHRDSEASAPSIFSLRYWSPPWSTARGGAGERYFCAKSVGTPGDQKDARSPRSGPLSSASPPGSVRWAAGPKPPVLSLRRRFPESLDPDKTGSSF